MNEQMEQMVIGKIMEFEGRILKIEALQEERYKRIEKDIEEGRKITKELNGLITDMRVAISKNDSVNVNISNQASNG